MRAQFTRIADTLHKSRALASGTSKPKAAATIYALANETVFLRLTDGYGWTQADYANWLADILIATLLQPTR